MPDNKTYEGYDYEPEIGAGKYLSLKKKGDEVVFRLVSTPKHKAKHWIMGDSGKKTPINCTEDASCPWCGTDVPSDEKVAKNELFAWLVIDRADGEVKMFSAPTLIYKKIKALLNSDDWGDPKNYDLRVKRVEDPGDGYYTVIPVPKGMGPITEQEEKAVSECSIDLMSELEGGKDTKTFGGGSKSKVSLETDDEVEEPSSTDTDDLPF